MTHEELRGLIPLLALDALPPGEEEELVAHLKVCRECSDVLASHETTTGMLGLAVPPIEPSMQLRERILNEAARTRQMVPPTSITSVRRARRPGGRVAAALAAAAVFAIGAVGTRQLMESNDLIARQQAQLAAQEQAFEVASAGSALILPMKTSGDFSDVNGSVVVSESAGKAAVILTGLQDPDGKVYTVWLSAEGGGPTNVGEFVPAEDGLAVVNLNTAVADRDTVAVTLEPKRGLTRPTGPMVGSALRA